MRAAYRFVDFQLMVRIDCHQDCSRVRLQAILITAPSPRMPATYIDPVTFVAHFEVCIDAMLVYLTDHGHVRYPILGRGTCKEKGW